MFESERTKTAVRSCLLWAVLANFPLFLYYVAHFLQEGIPTGFILADVPYYSANARAIFEKGDGVFYPNPYDTNPDSPAIYFQWLIWVMGVGIVQFGFDPGIQYVVIGAMAAIVNAYLTFRLVEYLLPTPRMKVALFLLTMWSGGLFVVFTMLDNIVSHEPILFQLNRLMPFGGWWFLSWGINGFQPHEGIYHCFVMFMWLSLLKNRTWSAVWAVTMLAATHPFTGLQHLAGIGIWLGIGFLKRPSWKTFSPPFLVAIISATFLFYYRIYLRSFPSHSALEDAWELEDWILTNRDMILAYAPVATLAILRLVRDRDWHQQRAALFIVSFLATLFFAKHELWLPTSKQPIHFTHGYLWMPLWLLALPLIQQWLHYVCNQEGKLRSMATLSTIVLVAISDVAGWIYSEWPSHRAEDQLHPLEYNEPFTLTSDQWKVITWFQNTPHNSYLLSSDREVSYLIPTYSPHKTYIGHWANTPHYEERMEKFDRWKKTREHDGWLDDIDFIILEREFLSPKLSDDWEVVFETPGLVVFRRLKK